MMIHIATFASINEILQLKSFKFMFLLPQARPLLARALDDDDFDALVDPNLGKSYNRIEMRRMIACAAAAVRHSARRRPRTSQVSFALLFLYV